MATLLEARPASVWPRVVAPPRAAMLAAAGALLLLGQAAMVLLYTNVPAGYQSPAGLTREAVAIFGAAWQYPRLTLDGALFPLLAAGAIGLSWAAYLVAIGVKPTDREARVVFAVAALIELFLVALMPPVLSSDVFLYGMFGRMVAFHGLNPYAGGNGDPIGALSVWSDAPSLYGPGWTWIAAGAAALAGRSVLGTAIAFKAVAALAHLANGWLVLTIARRLGVAGSTPALLYLWNPLVLMESAGSGHNDALMVTFVLAGLLLAIQERRTWAAAALSLAVFVKFVPLLVLFFLVVRWAAAADSVRRWLVVALRPSALLVAIGALLYAPFATGADLLAPVLGYSQAQFHTPVRFALVAIAEPLLGASLARLAVSAGLTASFGLLVLRLAWRIHRQPSWPRVVESWAAASLYYAAVVYPFNFPWWLIAPLAGAAVVRNRRAGRLVFALATVAGAGWTWIQYGVLVPL